MFPHLPQRNEAHLVQCKNGHHLSIDCWCEPNRIYWRRNAFGVLYLIVEHNDDTLRNHTFVLNERKDNPDWVDRALATVLETKKEDT